MRVLITGGSGFLGKHCVAALSQNNVELLTCGTRAVVGDARHAVCNLHIADEVDRFIRDYAPTHLLHLAWNGGSAYATDRENVDWISSSVHLLRAFYEQGGKRFVGVGTCFEYALRGESCCEQTSPTLPVTLYGKSKLAFAQYLSAYAEANALSYAWCRLFYMYGPGEAPRRLIPSACRASLEGKPFHAGAYNATLDYMDVRDVARALAAVLLAEHVGVVNVASGIGRQVKDILHELCVLTGGTVCAAPDAAEKISIVARTDVLRQWIGFCPQFSLQQTLSDCYADIKGRQ